MKINKIFSLLIVSLMLFVSCEPIVDSEELKNTTNVDGVEVVATQSTPGGNEITLQMNTPGITGYWDYFFGKGLTDRITFSFPLTGTFDFKFKGTLGAEFFEKSVSVTIDVLDHPVAPEWAALLGDDPFAGKYWEFKKDDERWWYMTAPRDPSAWSYHWWNANDCCGLSDANGEMHFYFDPELGIKYDYYTVAGGTPQTFDFALTPGDGGYGAIKIIGGNILGGFDGRQKSSGEYTVITLVEDEFILYAETTDIEDTGWGYKYRPVED